VAISILSKKFKEEAFLELAGIGHIHFQNINK